VQGIFELAARSLSEQRAAEKATAGSSGANCFKPPYGKFRT